MSATTEPRKPHQPRGTIDPRKAADKARGDAIERAYAHECEIRRLMQPGWRSRWSIAPADLRVWYESLPTNQDDEATR